MKPTVQKQDLFGGVPQFFTEEEQEKILSRAQERLDSGEPLEEILRDFHRSNYWGFQGSYRKPKPPSRQKTVSQELWPYIRTLIMTALVMKSVVYFFGLEAAQQPSLENWLLFAGSLTLSIGSLFYFAFRHK